jgi:hypothetical protein
MAWQSPHPYAVTVDEGPKLIGSRWRRRDPEGDPWDGPVSVVGVFDLGDSGSLELVVQTVAFTGEPTLTADSDSFLSAYVPYEPDPLATLRDRVADLERMASA